MPIIKSAIKRARQQEKRRSRNLVVLRAVKKDAKAVTTAVAAADTKAATEALQAATSELDRAVKKGVLHQNTAARHKSRLAKLVNTLGATKPKAAAKTTVKKAPVKKATTNKPAAKKPAAKSAKK